MRVVAAAAVMGLVLSILPYTAEPRAAHGCSYAVIPADRLLVLETMARADLVVSGLIIDEVDLAEDLESANRIYSRVTLRVDQVLKGDFAEPYLIIENDTAPCGDIGPQLRQGDNILLSLVSWPTWTFHGQPMDPRWMMPRIGSTVRFVGGVPYADEAWGNMPDAHLGDRDEFLRVVGAHLQLPQSEIDALLALHTDIDGPAGRWTLTLQLMGVLVLLASVRMAIARMRFGRIE